jgi:hypothetical protein
MPRGHPGEAAGNDEQYDHRQRATRRTRVGDTLRFPARRPLGGDGDQPLRRGTAFPAREAFGEIRV